jgi:CysZ protein
MKGFSKGCADVVWAASFMAKTPTLWKFVVAPSLVALIIAAAIVWFCFGIGMGYADSLVAALPGWLSFIDGFVRLIVIGTLLLAGYVMFIATTSLCTAPFCEMLSESVELSLGGEEPPGFSLTRLLADLGRGLGHSLRRLLVFLVGNGVLFLASLILPLIGAAIFLVGGAWLSMRFMAYDTLDCVWARKSYSYEQKMSSLRQVRGRAYGVGAITALLLVVPVINLLAMPLGAIAATRLHVEEFRQ